MPTGTRAVPGTLQMVQRGGRSYWLVKLGQGCWQYEHRVLGACRLGRALRPREVVHHKNGDGLDNRLCNLEVIGWGEHSRQHHRITTWAQRYRACRQCRTTERKHLGGGLCSRCYQRQPGKRWKDRRVRHASRK